MKKSLLLILASLFAVFALAGCAEDSKNNNGGTTPTPTPSPLPADISTLEGTYNIDFFYTDGGGAAVVTTDCTKVTEYVGSSATQCTETGSVEHQGRLTFDVLEDGSVEIISKIQMAGRVFETGLGAAAKNLGANYNYTEYTAIPANAISETKINDPATGHSVKGVQGRNAVSITPYDVNSTATSQNAANTTYEFTYENGVLICKMKDTSSLMAADVVIRLTKTADTIEVFDAQTPFDTPAIDNFVNFYNNIIGSYSIDSLSLYGYPQDPLPTDYARINSNNNHLSLALLLMGKLNVFVYSEVPAALMASGLTVDKDTTGKTTVDFSIPGLAEIGMTRNQVYTTAQGVGEKQENISLNINGGKNITDTTKEFNVVISQPAGAADRAYTIAFYDNMQIPSLPAGSYVGLQANPNFIANPADCSTKSGVTTCKVSVSGLTSAATETPYIVVVTETDAEGNTGASAIGVVKLSAASSAQ